MKIIAFFYDVIKKTPYLLIFSIFVQVLAGLGAVASVLTIAPLIDYFTHPDLQDLSPITLRVIGILKSMGLPINLVSFLGTFLAFQALKGLLNTFAYHLIFRTKYAVLRDFLVGTFDEFFRARWQFFCSNKQGTLLNTFTREIIYVGDAVAAMVRLFTHSLQVCFYLSVPFYISWQITCISIGVGLAVAVPFLLLGKLSYRLGRLNTSTGNEMTAVIHENIGVAKVILGFGNQLKSVETLACAFDAHRKVTIKSQTLQVAISFLYEPFGLLVIACAILMGESLGVTFAELAVLLWALRSTIPLVGCILSEKNLLMGSLPSYEQILNLREQARQLSQRTGGRLFKGFLNAVAVENLTFAYPGQEPILINVSICIPKGKIVALVGESGAGKSTLIDVLMGLNEPQSGSITIDGVPLEQFDLASYRRLIGYVPQESILFNMTIRENLLWADEYVTQADIEQACRHANAEEFIRSFPDGYDTVVGDRGERLSGGQRQRIALARAILRKPELLVLDEATSSLDTHSERMIQSAIENISKDTTVIVIAHRLSTIVNADHIYVIRGGQIMEDGTYQELERKGKYFKKMVKLRLEEDIV